MVICENRMRKADKKGKTRQELETMNSTFVI